jgi:hypothetical protein
LKASTERGGLFPKLHAPGVAKGVPSAGKQGSCASACTLGVCLGQGRPPTADTKAAASGRSAAPIPAAATAVGQASLRSFKMVLFLLCVVPVEISHESWLEVIHFKAGEGWLCGLKGRCSRGNCPADSKSCLEGGVKPVVPFPTLGIKHLPS